MALLKLVPFRLNMVAKMAIQKIQMEVWSLRPDMDLTPGHMNRIAEALSTVSAQFDKGATLLNKETLVQMASQLRPLLGPLNCIEIHWSIDTNPISMEGSIPAPPIDVGVIQVTQ